MRKIILLLAVFAMGAGLVMPVSAAKYYGLSEAASRANYDTSGSTSVNSIVQNVINAFLALMGFVFFGLMTAAGIRWLTARGNEEFVTKARETMFAAIWGLVIILAAYGLTTFIFSALNN